MPRESMQSIPLNGQRAVPGHAPEVSRSVLQRAEALGRRARARGLSVLDMATLLHRALENVSHPEIHTNGNGHGDGEGHGPAADPGSMASVARRCLAPFHDGVPVRREEAFMRILNDRREADLKRISRRLHDSAFQLLSALRMDLERAVCASATDRARFDPVRARIQEVEEDLRRLAHELRPAGLQELGLVDALRLLARDHTHSSAIDVRVRGRLPGRLEQDVETAVYRVAQEAIFNAVRHSGAHSVDVVLAQTKGWALCRVIDDGTGFDPSSVQCRRGLGLIGMRERLMPVHGTLRIDSSPGRGTVIAADVPLQEIHDVSHPAG